MAPEVLVDLNVVLDVLQRREPHFAASAKVWEAIESGQLRGFVAAHSVTTLSYLLGRHLGRAGAVAVIQDLLEVFSIAPVDEKVLRNALVLNWNDFEDGVQMAAAASVGAQFLITRNPTDFQSGAVKILQPASLPSIISIRDSATSPA